MIWDLFGGSFDAQAFLIDLLLRLPAFLLAISLHEAAHAYVAERCGDPTARMLGRVTINPIKHLDPLGLLMMVVVGVGWAKPVPVNPRNFRNYRRDDLLVSIAGVTANLLQFVVGCLVMYTVVAVALGQLPTLPDGGYLVSVGGEDFRLMARDAFLFAPGMHTYLIEPVMGTTAGYAFQMLVNYVVINISLAAFNLLPVPPLDGYHVVNDLLFKRPLFTSRQVAGLGMVLLLVLSRTGLLSRGLSFVVNHALNGAAVTAHALLGALHIV